MRVLVLLLALGGVAEAQDDPDTEIARRHFRKGSEFYSAGDYPAALKEFEAARRAFPSPAIDYNIARCHDRLENVREAIDYYERYLATAKDAPDAPEIARRIQALKQRLGEPPAPKPKPEPPPVVAPAPVAVAAPPPARSKKRTWAIVGGVLGGVALVGLAVGLAVGLQGGPSYSTSATGPIQSTP